MFGVRGNSSRDTGAIEEYQMTKTTKDVILEHAEQTRYGSSTTQGTDFLKIENKPEHYVAGNLYLAALRLIRQLTDKGKKGRAE